MRSILLALVLIALTTPALASDGVLEINQTCIGTGCFSGDDPGYPVTITRPGSYVLTSNLTANLFFTNTLNNDVVQVAADNVQVDLNGFRIACQQFPDPGTHCVGPGSGVNVSDPASISGTTVINGTVTRFGGYGIRVGSRSRVSGILAVENATGIEANVSSRLIDNTCESNSGPGIHVAGVFGSVIVRGNVVDDNGGQGILVDNASAEIRGNTAFRNGGDGIYAGGGGSVLQNVSRDNAGDGISCSFGCVVSDNSSGGNDFNGIDVGVNSVVRNNSLSGNALYGLDAGWPVGYGANVFGGASLGPIKGGQATNTGQNVCGVGTTCTVTP